MGITRIAAGQELESLRNIGRFEEGAFEQEQETCGVCNHRIGEECGHCGREINNTDPACDYFDAA